MLLFQVKHASSPAAKTCPFGDGFIMCFSLEKRHVLITSYHDFLPSYFGDFILGLSWFIYVYLEFALATQMRIHNIQCFPGL